MFPKYRARKILPSGYRSKFEERIAAQLTKAKIKFKYEEKAYAYEVKVPNAYCGKCGSREVVTPKLYTPDFFIKEIILEGKGKFTGKDRKKMVAMKQRYPEMDIRMVFMADNKLSKVSKTRYSTWAKDNGFKFCVGPIPAAWLKEMKGG